MNAYRTQQQFRAKTAEIERQQREICKQYGLHIMPDKQERSGTTGHNQTLTRAQKCAIIVKKAIRRHVRRAIKSYRRAKTMYIKIRLTQDAYINNGECRLHTDSGKPSALVLRDWYEATATDNDGNEYRVIWAVRDDWDAESGDESDACDWDNPTEITRLDTGDNVTSYAKIEW